MLAVDSDLRKRLGTGARRAADALGWKGELAGLGRSYREVIRRAALRDALASEPRLGTLAP